MLMERTQHFLEHDGGGSKVGPDDEVFSSLSDSMILRLMGTSLSSSNAEPIQAKGLFLINYFFKLKDLFLSASGVVHRGNC